MSAAADISESKTHLRLAYEYALLTQYSNGATEKYYSDLMHRHFLQAAKTLGYEMTKAAMWPPDGGE